MICIPKLALEIQDLSLPATVLSPRLDDTVPRVCRKWGVQFSLVGARTEIWKIYFGRITYPVITRIHIMFI
jgi:hypothetical protein